MPIGAVQRSRSRRLTQPRLIRTRSSDGGATFTLLTTVSAGVTTYRDGGLTAGTTYSYYVVTLLNSARIVHRFSR